MGVTLNFINLGGTLEESVPTVQTDAKGEYRSPVLPPGKYTVVGTRPGFRDVRREITVVPGAAPAPVVIRCEDRI